MNTAYKDYGYKTEQLSVAHSYLLPRLILMLGPPIGPILDLGCGNGAIAHALISKGYDVYGVDASISGVSIANSITPGRFFLDVASGKLPVGLENKKFLYLIFTEVIEHLYDPRSFVLFARKILSPTAGEFIISTPYHDYLKNLVLAITGKLDKHFTALWLGGHIKFFSKKSLALLLKEENFQVIDFAGAGRLPFLWKSMMIKAKVV